jgi:apolipoprotein D and lipocalin family protein
MKILILSLLLLFSGCLSGQKNNNGKMIDKSTVKSLDIDRYAGKWYEIARFPNSFEKNLVGVTATYKLRSNGKIDVINQGYMGSLDGKLKTAKGKAYIPDKKEPGKLKVAFFLFFYADYYVMELDTINYQWALIGSSTDKYLWILSRTPQLDPETYQMLIDKAKKRGYNVDKLIPVVQKNIENN